MVLVGLVSAVELGLGWLTKRACLEPLRGGYQSVSIHASNSMLVHLGQAAAESSSDLVVVMIHVCQVGCR